MAVIRWIGAAQDIPDERTYTFAGVWAAGKKVTITLNNKSLIYTCGTTVDTTTIAAGVAAMINARSKDATKVSATRDETYNFGGQEIPEFTELTATSSGAVLTIRSTPGVPVLSAASDWAITEDAAGDITAATVQTATGRHFFDNAKNWSGGTAPGTTDTILLDQGSISIKYGLANTTGEYHLVKTNAYTGDVGLPAVNPLGYTEYRARYLILLNVITTGAQTITIGERNSSLAPAGLMLIDLGAVVGASQTIKVYSAPKTASGQEYAVQFIRGAKIAFESYGGSISLGDDNSQAANSTSIEVCNIRGDSKVLLGARAQFASSALHLIEDTATCNNYCAVAGVFQTTMTGGTMSFGMSNTSSTTIIMRGGTLFLDSGTVTLITSYSGVISSGQDDVVVTTIAAFKGTKIRNRSGRITWTNGIDCYGCQIVDVLESTPDNYTWTQSAI